MSSTNNQWGPTPTGYELPTLQELIDQEKAAMLVGNPGLTFPPGSKDLATVEARAKIRLADWESRQCQYFANNPCNAEGCQLDIQLRLRGFYRKDDESDADYLARYKSAQAGNGWIAKLEGRILECPGVCRVRVFNNDTEFLDPATGLPGGAYEVAYEETSPGAADKEKIAEIIWKCSTGAKRIGTDVCLIEDVKGRCRKVKLTPVNVSPHCVRIRLTTFDSSCGCDNQTEQAIKEAALAVLNIKNSCGRNIGDPVHAGLFNLGISGIRIDGLDFFPSDVDADGNCTCIDVMSDDWNPAALNLGPREVASFDLDCICILSRDL